MAILTGNNKTDKKPTMTANTISPAMHDQLQSIIESGKDNDTVSKRSETALKNKRKEKNADTVNLVLPKGERNSIKVFCSENGISMTEYAFTCMDYIRSEVQAGNMTVSRAGIRILNRG